MDKAKPIEPGCLALILDGCEFTGQIRTAVSKEYSSSSKAWGWRMDPPLSRPGVFEMGIIEEGLMRIDDPDIQKQIETEREKEHG